MSLLTHLHSFDYSRFCDDALGQRHEFHPSTCRYICIVSYFRDQTECVFAAKKISNYRLSIYYYNIYTDEVCKMNGGVVVTGF